ncbi:hypothetical protein F5Y11DRAFT_35324 [Daldinia sp. FL1419]|nr:hypothetical protein F5Y11DRAFT_35324 [Daldinia sp. FL1419]
MEFTNPYDDYQRALNYDFQAELAPGVWTLCSKLNRTIFLAHDITAMLVTNSPSTSQPSKTDLALLLDSNKIDLLGKVKAILNHENLICLRDWFSVATQKPKSTSYEKRTFIVWDNCDAGTLENILVEEYDNYKPSQQDDGKPLPTDEQPDTDTEMKDTHEADDADMSKFLPESLCWHVVTSVLKALAWLHEGSPELVAIGPRKFGMDPTADWSPILHREITPANIQFQQPRRLETYGQCKLGNYSNLYISSHHNGDGKSKIPRIKGKALAPRLGKESMDLNELIQYDHEYGYTYKEQPNQPYTIISEWRALGEIMMAMMVPPSGTKTNVNDHIQNVSQYGVRYNLAGADYSAALKNVVIRLMTLNPDEKTKDGQYLFPNRDTLTSNLCVDAFEKYMKWRVNSDEGRSIIDIKNQQNQQILEDAEARDEILAATAEMKKIVDNMQLEYRGWALDEYQDAEIDDAFDDWGFTYQNLATSNDTQPFPPSMMPPSDYWEFDD